MSMNSYACHGYIVPVSEFLSVIPDNQIEAFEKAVDEHEEEILAEILSASILSGIEFSVFHLSDEDFADDLETGIIYVSFDPRELYEMKPTKQLLALRRLDIEPAERLWTVWG